MCPYCRTEYKAHTYADTAIEEMGYYIRVAVGIKDYMKISCGCSNEGMLVLEMMTNNILLSTLSKPVSRQS